MTLCAVPKVIAKCLRGHRHTGFLQFLGQAERQTPKWPTVQPILAHPSEGSRVGRGPSALTVSLHGQGGPWLNQLKLFLAELTRQRIRPGTFRSVRELEKAIQDYVWAHNHRVWPFAWRATASRIIRKVLRIKEPLVTAH